MRLRVYHTTRYEYAAPVWNSHNEARLMPLTDDDQTCLDFRLATTPESHPSGFDLPSGRVHHFNIREPHAELIVTAESLVLTHNKNPMAGFRYIDNDSGFYRQDDIRERYAEFLAPTERVPLHPESDRIAAVVEKQQGPSTASFLITLNKLLHRAFTFAPGETTVKSSIADVLEKQRGVCQDFAHLMLAVCRRKGIPARYVSGYMFTGQRNLPPIAERERLDTGENGESLDSGEDAAHRRNPRELVGGNVMHAWVECLLPDGRWHGFDPTNNVVTNDGYVKVHWGRDYGDIIPLHGVYTGPAKHTLTVGVRVVSEDR